MTEVIFDELTAARDAALRDGEQLAHRARAFLAAHIHHKEGTTVNLSQLAADVRNGLGTLQSHAQDDYNAIKETLEEKLPEIERVGQLMDSDPLVQLALGELVPAPLRQIAADAVSSVVKAFQAAPAAPAEPAPAPVAEAPADGLPAQ